MAVKIDTDRLMKIVRDTGLSQKEFAEGIGRTTSYLSTVKKTGTMNNASIKMICSVYGCDKADFVSGMEKEEQIEIKDVTLAEIIEKLTEISNDIISLMEELEWVRRNSQ